MYSGTRLFTHASICFRSSCAQITQQPHPGPELACFVVDRLLQAQQHSIAQSTQQNRASRLVLRAHHSATMQAKSDSCRDPSCRRASPAARCGFKASEYMEICPVQKRMQPQAVSCARIAGDARRACLCFEPIRIHHCY